MQKKRRLIIILSFMLFPVTMNYLSPYIPMDAAMQGIIAGSLITFACLFLAALFTGRAWCGWLCPIAGLSDVCLRVSEKPADAAKLRRIRRVIGFAWASLVVLFFVLAGGMKGFNPLYYTDTGVSVDSPYKFVIYYGIIAAFLIVTLKAGKRGGCHSICWMTLFLESGRALGRKLGLPQCRIKASGPLCVGCGSCNKACPMGVAVSHEVGGGYIFSKDCIFCGECVDACRKNALAFSFERAAQEKMRERQEVL